MSVAWSEMIENFRRLGGIAKNVEQRQGQYGNGIFPVVPNEAVAISIPDNLLVSVEDVFLSGDRLKISQTEKFNAAEIEFLEGYFNDFSWGRDGRMSMDAFESSLRTMPQEVRDFLFRMGILNLEKRHEGDWDKVIFRRFVESRQINYEGRKVLMPIIELINHSAAMPGYAIGKGIHYSGKFSDEVLVNYSPMSDALIRFLNYGFASPEDAVYSLPMTVNLTNGERIRVGFTPSAVQDGEPVPIPKLQKNNDGLAISHLKLGIKNTPRMPKGIFRHLMKDYPASVADEAFERIRCLNLSIYAELLGVLNKYEEAPVRDLRQAVHHQLTALSYCYGCRDFNEFKTPQSAQA